MSQKIPSLFTIEPLSRKTSVNLSPLARVIARSNRKKNKALQSTVYQLSPMFHLNEKVIKLIISIDVHFIFLCALGYKNSFLSLHLDAW